MIPYNLIVDHAHGEILSLASASFNATDRTCTRLASSVACATPIFSTWVVCGWGFGSIADGEIEWRCDRCNGDVDMVQRATVGIKYPPWSTRVVCTMIDPAQSAGWGLPHELPYFAA